MEVIVYPVWAIAQSASPRRARLAEDKVLSASLIPRGLGAFWANELVIPNIPIGSILGGVPIPPGGYPLGSLWYYPDSNGNKVVYVI